MAAAAPLTIFDTSIDVDDRLQQSEYERQRLANVRPPTWRNPPPSREPYDLVVIGGGPAGLVSAEAAVELGARVAIVERNALGGNCLNFGCVPSKALIRTSRVYADIHSAAHYGARASIGSDVEFAAIIERMRRIRARISRVDSARRLVERGIDVFFGDGAFAGRHRIDVAGATLSFRRAIVATGARPDTPKVPGLAQAGYLTNETVFDLAVLPKRLLVIGGGPLGCELAQAFCRFGARTTIAQDQPLFLPREERDAAQLLSEALARDGVEVRLNTAAVRVRVDDGAKVVDLVSDDYHSRIVVDEILTGVGRVPNVDGLNLEAAGIAYDASGIATDDFLRTTNPRVYAAGDVTLAHAYTHTADASARIVVRNALLGKKARVSALTIPWCTYTDPEIAHVGLYVREARERDIPVRTFTIPMHDVDRAITDGEELGFVKIHVHDHSDRILGATIVARHAGEMINEITLAMVANIGLATLARVIHAYPTQAEAIRAAAIAFERSQQPVRRRATRFVPW
ncbi:MAG TPA: mercuric reductase [Casimicrobiaceae bacterium]|nr:mercuric reductase [Casimicrobiaceae bacterium]